MQDLDVETLSLKELKALITIADLSFADCLDRADLKARARKAQSALKRAPAPPRSAHSERSVLTWAAVGNATNGLLLLLAVAHLAASVGHVAGEWQLESFGVHWAHDGFCRSSHTHIICFYANSMGASVLYQMSRRSNGRAELGVLKDSVASVWVLGLVHAGLSVYENTFSRLRADSAMLDARSNRLAYLEITGFAAAAFVVWAAALHSATPNPLWLTLTLSTAHTVMVGLVVPSILSFTYVFFVLFCNIVMGQLLCGLRGARDQFYALHALLLSAPIMAAAWLEPLLCDAMLIEFGGHLFFNLSIPASAAMYFVVAERQSPRKAAKLA
jgi:hypothetical protein